MQLLQIIAKNNPVTQDYTLSLFTIIVPKITIRTPITFFTVNYFMKNRIDHTIDHNNAHALLAYAIDKSNFFITCCHKSA